ncbi:hypothetical protein A9Q99_14335 [Gammaproteobacteria bacterium 45_16_T64]|nr:hypothetical protein A9Q99_14335 [Gammaproteobacteria bacterium 45_16_T64]
MLNQIVELFKERIPSGLEEAGLDLKQNLRALVAESLSNMDLVSREEFDIQSSVLARTRAKLEALEKTVSELEAQ